MGSLDDLPQRHPSHDLAQEAELAVEQAIEACSLFFVQHRDRLDYGTDIHLEARSGSAATNVRVPVQLKGTDSAATTDGSVCVAVGRTNLNYLLTQPHAVYVCYHRATKRLLARYAEDVFQEYERRDTSWRHQDTITIRFRDAFDPEFQRRLHSHLLATGRSTRDRRLDWLVTPPERVARMVHNEVPLAEVPPSARDAHALLNQLLDAGHDAVISKSFARFEAVLRSTPRTLLSAYLAEINLGINGEAFDEERVRRGIALIRQALTEGVVQRASALYSLGNGFFALREFEEARHHYNAALSDLHSKNIAPYCLKNMGSVLEAEGKLESARLFYERVLELDPALGEAHFALAMWYRRKGDNHGKVLEHLDAITRRATSAIEMAAVQGWRAEALFECNDFRAAFREIQSLISLPPSTESWTWDWCASLVAKFGTGVVESTERSLVFWQAYRREHPEHVGAELQRLLCLFQLHNSGRPLAVDYAGFKQAATSMIERMPSRAAFLWDRIGHWAQTDNDWSEAEKAFREAYDIEPERYGYCLGTALNFLRRYAEALPILLAQAEKHQRDAMSWFQVAVAREGTDDLEGCVEAYESALSLDPQYALAWFNLGGIFWNMEEMSQAITIWREAVARFPEHAQAQRVRDALPGIFD